MLGWIIVTVVCAVFSAICFWLHHKAGYWYGTGISNDTGWGVLGTVMVCFTLVPILVVTMSPITVKMNMGEFQSQKVYIESHVSKDPLEDATITNKKIELNSWLFSVQQAQKNFGIFTFYPETIWDLEPIQ